MDHIYVHNIAMCMGNSPTKNFTFTINIKVSFNDVDIIITKTSELYV